MDDGASGKLFPQSVVVFTSCRNWTLDQGRLETSDINTSKGHPYIVQLDTKIKLSLTIANRRLRYVGEKARRHLLPRALPRRVHR